MDRTLVGIDVGTTKVCVVIGEIGADDRLRIVGVGHSRARGMRKGMVANVEECSQAIRTAVAQAERVSGYHVDHAYVGVTGEHIQSNNARGVVAITHGSRTINSSDVQRAIENAQANINVSPTREIVHLIPRAYRLDGQDGIREPVGMQAFRLEADVHIVTGATASLHNLVRAVERAGIQAHDLVLEPLASAEATLSPAERDMGVCLADIGGGTTDVAIFNEGAVVHTGVIAVAGYQFTNDIAVVLRTPYEIAENIKCKHGHVLPEAVLEADPVPTLGFDGGRDEKVPRRFVAEVLEARSYELFRLIMEQIDRAGYADTLPAGVVLTGGTGQLEGLRDLGRHLLSMPVRVGVPEPLDGLTDSVRGPAYSTAIGLLLWAMRYSNPEESTILDPHSGPDIISRFFGWVRRAFLPG
ncbi:MAG: cell division protein FtsA [Anaerolineae bacterium]